MSVVQFQYSCPLAPTVVGGALLVALCISGHIGLARLMTRDYCLGFVTNVMLQDGDDHNHDPTVNWRLNINVERLGLTSRNLVVVFSWTW